MDEVIFLLVHQYSCVFVSIFRYFWKSGCYMNTGYGSQQNLSEVQMYLYNDCNKLFVVCIQSTWQNWIRASAYKEKQLLF